jgi:hypothetical protein
MIYLVITLTPLAPFAMHSKMVAHAITGECVGDCDICGCSPESRANHTCCCAKKKQKQAGLAKLIAGECCAPKVSDAPTAVKGSCCAASQTAEPVVAKNDCCARNKRYQHDENVQESQHKEERSKNETVYKCGNPCGKGKLFALAGVGTPELLPYIYSLIIAPHHDDTHYSHLSQRRASRHADPPDPPPKLPVSA